MAFHPVDIHFGKRVRQRRALLGMSQTALGDGVRLTFQQVQKYERGSNRITASRLLEFSKILDVPVEHFFEAMPADVLGGRAGSAPGNATAGEAGPLTGEKDPLVRPETLELVRSYYKIREPVVRKRLFEMVK